MNVQLPTLEPSSRGMVVIDKKKSSFDPGRAATTSLARVHPRCSSMQGPQKGGAAEFRVLDSGAGLDQQRVRQCHPGQRWEPLHRGVEQSGCLSCRGAATKPLLLWTGAVPLSTSPISHRARTESRLYQLGSPSGLPEQPCLWAGRQGIPHRSRSKGKGA